MYVKHAFTSSSIHKRDFGLGYPRRTCQKRCLEVSASLGDALRSIFDFDSWAPRSSRQWRLRPVPGEAELKAEATSPLLESLSEDLATAYGERSLSVDDLRNGLEQRAVEFPGNLQLDDVMTGGKLKSMIFAKYGMYYDLSIVRRDIPGRTLVRLNVMWTHLKQISFPMSEREYDEKLDTIAFYIRSWGQEDVVKQFFSEPPRAQRGLPARPTVGSAVSIRLELEPAIVQEWFS